MQSVLHANTHNFLLRKSLVVNQPLILQLWMSSTRYSPCPWTVESYWVCFTPCCVPTTHWSWSPLFFAASNTVPDSSNDISACMRPPGSPPDSIGLCPVTNELIAHEEEPDCLYVALAVHLSLTSTIKYRSQDCQTFSTPTLRAREWCADIRSSAKFEADFPPCCAATAP